MTTYLLAIDQGTTSTRALIFDTQATLICSHQIAFSQYFPQNGWVEHDPEEIWQTTFDCCEKVLQEIPCEKIAAIGISNQRETTIIWDKKTGEPIYPAIVWQDRRTAKYCETLSKDEKIKQLVSDKTGLLIDAYFSASKISWILDHVDHARTRAEKGELAFGTIDTFLLWKLTNGKSFATDATNASRTLLFNIHTQQWDDDLLNIFNIPKNLLPLVLDSNAHFGDTAVFDKPIAITGIAGDQQAATIGQACFKPGMMKSTYGTGCFMVLNTGKTVIKSTHHLLSTIAYRLNGIVTYALEGSIFSAGTGIQWLKENLKIITSAKETEQLAQQVPDTHGVYFIPAFTGLGAPYWKPDARAAIVGITRETEIAHIVRAALESIAYQTRDLLLAIEEDSRHSIEILRVDGGMTKNTWLLQFLADMLGCAVVRNTCVETSALGAALLAGLGANIYKNLEEIEQLIHAEAVVAPAMSDEIREKNYAEWQVAVRRVCQTS